MATINATKYRERLLAERRRLTGDRTRLNTHGAEPEASTVGDLSDFDPNHPGDTGTELFEREKAFALNDHLDTLLRQIDDALAKLDRGTYGHCDHCDQVISESRLAAIPYATLCIDCQSRVENP